MNSNFLFLFPVQYDKGTPLSFKWEHPNNLKCNFIETGMDADNYVVKSSV